MSMCLHRRLHYKRLLLLIILETTTTTMVALCSRTGFKCLKQISFSKFSHDFIFLTIHSPFAFIQSLFMLIFVSIYGSKFIHCTIKRLIIILNTQNQQCFIYYIPCKIALKIYIFMVTFTHVGG